MCVRSKCLLLYKSRVGDLRSHNICYHVAAFVIPLNLICNKTIFRLFLPFNPTDRLRVCVSLFVCLFDLILYVPSTIFQLNRDGSSWVEPIFS